MILSTGMENPYVPFGNSVGIPLLYTDVRLMDVPGLGYTVGDQPNPRGEICCRGPNAFAGYYREPDKTKETIDEDGFVMTGDVAELLPDGSFRIIDRSKNVFKMAQGG
jgi:long-chain acyl-CoA synthetase